MSPNLSRLNSGPLPVATSKYPSCTGHFVSMSLPLSPPRPAWPHLLRSLPSNSTTASDDGAPGVAPGLITAGCGRSGSWTCHFWFGSIGVSLNPRSGFGVVCAAPVTANARRAVKAVAGRSIGDYSLTPAPPRQPESLPPSATIEDPDGKDRARTSRRHLSDRPAGVPKRLGGR